MKRLPAVACSALTGASLWAGSYGVGFQTAFDLGESGAVAPRVDYLRATDSSTVAGPFSPINLSATVDCLSLGADYDYFPGETRGEGFYALAGLGVATARINVSGSTFGASSSASSRQTLVYPEAGAGYQFNWHLGAEILYKALDFRDVTFAVAGTPVAYSFSGNVQASLVVRF